MIFRGKNSENMKCEIFPEKILGNFQKGFFVSDTQKFCVFFVGVMNLKANLTNYENTNQFFMM